MCFDLEVSQEQILTSSSGFCSHPQVTGVTTVPLRIRTVDPDRPTSRVFTDRSLLREAQTESFPEQPPVVENGA